MLKLTLSCLILPLIALSLSGCDGECPDGSGGYCVLGTAMECVGSEPNVTCTPTTECVSFSCDPGPALQSVLHQGETSEIKSSPQALDQITNDRAMSMIANGNMATAHSLGLRSDDFSPTAAGIVLSDERAQQVAQNNSSSVAAVKSKIDGLNAEFASERRQVTSVYWQTCIQSGLWSTDQSSSCSHENSPGCSPGTGATLCISKTGKSVLGI